MKTIQIDKIIRLDEVDASITDIEIVDDLLYLLEEQGYKITGDIYINVHYNSEDKSLTHTEQLEFDILAPIEKLDGEEFKMVLNSHNYTFEDDLIIKLVYDVYGISDKNYDDVQISSDIENDVYIPEEVVQPLFRKPLFPEIEEIEEIGDTIQVEQALETNDMIDDVYHIKEDVVTDSFDDLFTEEENVFTSYRIVVAKKNDTYESIAYDKGVDINELKRVNKNKEIQEKCLIILP